MSREDLVAVGIRLFAIYLALASLRMLAGIIALMSQPEGMTFGSGLLTNASVVALFLAVAAWLWTFPLSVARRLLPVMKEARSEDSAGPAVLVSVALTLMGVWLLAGALVDGTYWVTWVAMVRSSGFEAIPFNDDQIANMVATGVELVLALVLIFGASGLRRLLFRLRYGPAAEGAAD